MDQQRGYLVITVALFLALVILAVSLSLGSSSWLTRSSVLDYASKKSSYGLTRSCLDQALLQLALNSGYGGNETLILDSYQCSILPLETSGSNKIIKARSQINSATTNLKLTVNSSTLDTVSLEEISKF